MKSTFFWPQVPRTLKIAFEGFEISKFSWEQHAQTSSPRPPQKKRTNGPLLIHSRRLLYSNLLATSIFIETPEDGLNTNMNMAYSSKCKTTVFEIQTKDICTLPPWRPHYRKVLLMISSTELKIRTTFPDSINVGTWKWKKKTTRQHTLRSQYDFVDAKDTETGKKSPGCPEMLNSMLPLLLDESMTGSCHSRIECLWS